MISITSQTQMPEIEFKLKPEIKKSWLTALRSGEFAQGTRYLKREIDGKMEYCCLGVLSEICGVPNERVSYAKEPTLFRDEARQYLFEFTSMFLDPNPNLYKYPIGKLPLAEWFIENLTDIEVHEDDKVAVINRAREYMLALAKRNDAGWTFSMIADWIEENL